MAAQGLPHPPPPSIDSARDAPHSEPMLLRRAPGFVAALILLPLSILAPAIPGYTMMICRLTGTVVAADCNGAMPDAPDAPTPVGDAWQAASCCDTLQVTFQRAPAETHAEAPTLAASFVPVRSSLPPAIVLVPAGEARATAPPGLGPPRRLVTQTFLI